jgi:hypothetical protein
MDCFIAAAFESWVEDGNELYFNLIEARKIVFLDRKCNFSSPCWILQESAPYAVTLYQNAGHI